VEQAKQQSAGAKADQHVAGGNPVLANRRAHKGWQTPGTGQWKRAEKFSAWILAFKKLKNRVEFIS